MEKFLLVCLILAVVSLAQAQYGSSRQNLPVGPCVCPTQYIPFCGFDGIRETTFSNKCQLECAQRTNPNLRVKFEGVCAKPYIHNDDRSGKAGWGPVVAYPFPVTTRRPNYQQSRPPYGGSSFQRGPQFQSRPNYGSSISTPGQGRPSGSQSTGSSFQSRPTGSNFYPSGGSGLYESGRPGGSPSRYPAQVVTTRPPYTSGYQTTQSPYTQYTTTTTYRPRESSGSYGSGSSSSSQYRPYPATTTSTAKPWWQEARSRYPASSDNDNVDWRRNNRQLEDDDDVDNEPEEAEYP